MTQSPREPMFNLSERVPVWLAGILVVCHVIAHYGPTMLQSLAGYYGILRPLNVADGSGLLAAIFRLVGHGFLHADWGHLMMNSGMLIVFGIVTMRGIRAKKRDEGKTSGAGFGFIEIFLMGVVVGALFQWAWWAAIGDTSAAALGASGGASALFATAAWAIGGKDRLIGFGLGWALINAALVFGGPILGVNVAWAAHMGGYVGGAMIAPAMVKAYSSGFAL